MGLGAGTGVRGDTEGNTLGSGQGASETVGYSTLVVGAGGRSGDNDLVGDCQGRRKEGGAGGGEGSGGIGGNTVGREEAGTNELVLAPQSRAGRKVGASTEATGGSEGEDDVALLRSLAMSM